jgi:hypothetical protein
MLAVSTTRLAEPQADSRPAPDPLAVFIARCEARALLWQAGELDLHEAVDKLQADAVASGLVAQLGQDAVQAVMAKAFAAVRDNASGSTIVEALPDMVPNPLPESPDNCPGSRVEAPDDEYDGLSSSFAKACREADEKQRRKPVDPRIARARRLLEDDVSFERAWAELNNPPDVPTATLHAAEYLLRLGDPPRWRKWFDAHSAQERAAILQHLEQRRRGK